MAKLVISEAGQMRESPMADTVIIGRSKAKCDVVVEEPKASREHCRITREGEKWYIEDLGSSNGTKLNKEKISEKVEIKHGDRISIGVTEIVFQAIDKFDPDADLSGCVLGGYLIEKEIGRGGMGTVYKALQLSMNRVVALKVLRSMLSSDREFVKSFLREARLAGKHVHTGLIPVYEVGESGGTLFFSMEYVLGKDFKEIVDHKGAISLPLALKYVCSVLETLEYLHARDVYHLDIKPQNIIVTRDDRVRLMDLGLSFAKNMPGMRQAREKLKDRVIGSPGYMAPEQADSDKILDGRADIYSLACTLFFLTTGSPPFDTGSAIETLERNIAGKRPVAKEANPKMPASLSDLILKGMSISRKQRFQTAAEFRGALEEILPVIEKLAVKATAKQRSPVSAAPVSPPAGSGLYTLLVFLNVLAILGAVGSFGLWLLPEDLFISVTGVTCAQPEPPPVPAKISISKNPSPVPPGRNAHAALSPTTGGGGQPVAPASSGEKIKTAENETPKKSGGENESPDKQADGEKTGNAEVRKIDPEKVKTAQREIIGAIAQAKLLRETGDRVGACARLKPVLERYSELSGKPVEFFEAENLYKEIGEELNSLCRKSWEKVNTYSAAGRWRKARNAAAKALATDPDNKYSRKSLQVLNKNDEKTRKKYEAVRVNVAALLGENNFAAAREAIVSALEKQQLDGTSWGAPLAAMKDMCGLAETGYASLRQAVIDARTKKRKKVLLTIDGKKKEVKSVAGMLLKIRYGDSLPFTKMKAGQLRELLEQLEMEPSGRLAVAALFGALGNDAAAAAELGEQLAFPETAVKAARLLKLVAGNEALTFYDFSNLADIQAWSVRSGVWSLEAGGWESRSQRGGRIRWNSGHVSVGRLQVVISYRAESLQSVLSVEIGSDAGGRLRIESRSDMIKVISSIGGRRVETTENTERPEDTVTLAVSIAGEILSVRTPSGEKQFTINGLGGLAGDLELSSSAGPVLLESVLVRK